MFVNDITKKAGALGNVFEKVRKTSAKVDKKGTEVIKNLGRALEIGAKIGSAAVSKIHKIALTTIPDLVNLCHTGKGLYLRKFV